LSETQQQVTRKIIKIGLIRFPGVQQSALYGLADFFVTATALGQATAAAELHVEEVDLFAEVLPSDQFHALVCPPRLAQTAPEPLSTAAVSWLQAQHGGGSVLCSVCAGAFVLAQTGLLNGRPATTHWALKDPFAEAFPEVQLDIDKLVVDEGDVITAGGVMAWVDLGLRLIERFQTPGLMLEVARQFLVEPGHREQRYYSTFSPDLSHGDAAILKVQHWLQRRFTDGVSLEEMAAEAVLSERTFLRRFRKATGLSPIAYVQALRVEKARALLERTPKSFSEIAYEVGYQDATAFRAVFVRQIGLNPQEYRHRFGVGG
jgi:transcriptional regulator GlxA family with amidase domain